MGRRAVNESVEFIGVGRTTQHVGSRVNYTPNIFVHSLGINPTDMLPLNVSTITWHAYDTIVTFHVFFLRSNHERLILKRIELKRICVKEYLARICQDVSDKVAANVHAPLITPWMMPCPMIPTLMTAGSTYPTPIDKLLIPSKI